MLGLLTKIISPFFLLAVLFIFTPQNVSAAAYDISGKITNSSGANIEGATIEVLENDTSNVVQAATSNSSGDYSLNVEEGTYDVRVTPPIVSGLEVSTRADYSVNGNSVLDFILVSPPVVVSGTVLDYLGNPLENSNVNFQNVTTSQYAFAQTNSEGEYSLNLSPDNYNVIIEGATSFTTPSANIPQVWQIRTDNYAISENKTINYTVNIKKVEVHVLDENGVPVENANVKVGGASLSDLNLGGAIAYGSSSYQDGILTDSNGVATVLLYPTNNVDSKYVFVVTPPSGNPNTVSRVTDIEVVEDRELTITVHPPVKVSGFITDNLGNPLENAIINLNNQDLGTPFVVQTNASGYYESFVPIGSYSLLIEGTDSTVPSTNTPEKWQVVLDQINITEDKTIDYSVQVKKLEVHVTDENNLPVEGVLIKGDSTRDQLILDNQVAHGSSSYQDGILTDSNGVAILYLYGTTEEDGSVSLTLTPPSGSNYTTTYVNNIALLNDLVLPIELDKPVVLSGVISDYLGDPLENSNVTLNNNNNGSQFVSQTNSSGEYSMEVPPGNYRILIDGNNINTPSSKIPGEWQIGLDNIDIQVNKILNHSVLVKKVDVHVQNTSQSPIENARIQVSSASNSNLILDGQAAYGSSTYNNGIYTNVSGDATLWLYASDEGADGYTFIVTPPDGSQYAVETLENVSVQTNLSKVIELQSENTEPETITLNSIGDTYIRGGQDNRNYGAGDFMRVQSSGSNRAIVKFDQNAIEAAVGQGTILSAKVRVTITDNGNNWGTSGRTVDINRLTSSWNEGNGTESDRGTGSGATWACAIDSIIENQSKNCTGVSEWEMGQPNNPSVHPWIETPTDTQNITNNQTGVVEYDVTSDVQSFVANQNDNYGWLLKKTNEGQNGQVSFGTKESSFAPQLVITYQP